MKKLFFLFIVISLSGKNHTFADTIFAETHNDTAIIWHKDYHTSCGSLFMSAFRIEDHHIDLLEIDTNFYSYCLCYYNLNTAIGQLASGFYTVDVYEIYQPHYPETYYPDDSSYLGSTSFTIEGYPAHPPLLLSNYQSDCFHNVDIEKYPVAGRQANSFVSVNPNPIIGHSELILDIQKAGMVEVMVIDVFGKTNKTILHGFLDSGKHRILWDATGFPSGIYLLRLTGKDGFVTQKAIVSH